YVAGEAEFGRANCEGRGIGPFWWFGKSDWPFQRKEKNGKEELYESSQFVLSHGHRDHS
ncbi:hypothetical protein Ancab_035375, partial [Ancistrocladus abbreviatus]